MPTKHKQPEHKFKSLKLDAAIVMVGDDSDQAFQTMQHREDALVDYAQKSDERYDTIEGVLDATKKQLAEQTARADEAEKRPIVEDINKLVAERSKLMLVADSIGVKVGEDHDNLTIKREIILKADGIKADDLEGKSDEYISARYDSTKVDLARTQSGMKLLADAGGVGAVNTSPVAPKKSKRDLYVDSRFGKKAPDADGKSVSA